MTSNYVEAVEILGDWDFPCEDLKSQQSIRIFIIAFEFRVAPFVYSWSYYSPLSWDQEEFS